MIRETVNILGVNIDKITAADALERAKELLLKDGVSVISTPNPEIVMAAYENEEFKKVLNSSDMCVPDGIGVVYASKIIKNPLPERVAGFDLSCGLLESMGKTGQKVFLFGSKPGVAEKAADEIKRKWNVEVAGTADGYFGPEDEPSIIEKINNSGADLLLVCLGAPKQEKWIYDNKEKLNVKLCIGAGGSLDVLAGTAKRAPDVFIKLNLEWFYRICSQPSRIGRSAALPKFLKTVFINEKKK